MSDDFLKQFANALADEHDGATAVPEATRGRVIRTLAENRRRSRKWWVLGVPALALFGGSTAWAAATGHLPTMIDRAVAVFAFHKSDTEAPETDASSGLSKASAEKPEASSQPVLPEANGDEPEAPAKEPEDLRDEQREAEVARLTSNAKPSAAAPTSTLAHLDPSPSVTKLEQETSPEPEASALSTYRAAHRAQFQSGDCSAAVIGYQNYLSEDPQGSFALEAKYNRGVCFAKLGRTDEAVRALRPFADGQFGDYRQEKSRALIEALGSTP